MDLSKFKNIDINALRQLDLSVIFSKDNKNLPFVVIGIVIFLFIYKFVFIGPAIGTLSKLIPQASNIGSQISAAKKDINNKNNFMKELDGLQEKINTYKVKLPEEKEIPSILESLSDIAKDSDLKIDMIDLKKDTFDAKQQKKDSLYTVIPIVITAKCSYHQLGSFINKLENSERLIKVDDISIDGDKLNPRSENVKISISTYVLTKEGLANNGKK